MSNTDYIIELFLRVEDPTLDDGSIEVMISKFHLALRKKTKGASRGNKVLSMGKYKTQTLADIFVLDPPYLRYLYTMPRLSSYVFEDVREFLASIYTKEEMDLLDAERASAIEDARKREDSRDNKRRRFD